MAAADRTGTEASVVDVYLVTGVEALLVQQAVDGIMAQVMPLIGPPAFNLATYRCSEGGAVEAVGTARTLPMMAGRRLVVVREIEQGDDTFFQAVEDYLGNPSDMTTLVLAGSGFPKVVKGGRSWGGRIPKRVEACGKVIKYAAKDVDPVGFAMGRARDLGHSLSRDDAMLLTDLTGRDLSVLARELDKAALYADPGAPIDAHVIGAACSALAEKEVWDLTAGIAGRDPEAALGALHRLMEQGDAPHRLLSLVVWQLRLTLRVGELVRKGVPDDRIRSEVRMRSDVYRKLRRALGKDSRGAADVLERLARANRSMNSARSGDRRVLEALVLELTAG